MCVAVYNCGKDICVLLYIIVVWLKKVYTLPKLFMYLRRSERISLGPPAFPAFILQCFHHIILSDILTRPTYLVFIKFSTPSFLYLVILAYTPSTLASYISKLSLDCNFFHMHGIPTMPLLSLLLCFATL